MIDPRSLHGVRLLIADDDLGTLQQLMFYTKEMGWSGVAVTTADAILEAINEHCTEVGPCFDAIIADVNYWNNMDAGPKLSGITAAREIRKVHPNVPIIFITGYDNSMIREEIRRVKGELVPKPFDLEDLFVKVAQLIYWNRLGQQVKFPGDRRKNSINRTANSRRTGDEKLSPSPIITDIIQEIKREKENVERGKH